MPISCFQLLRSQIPPIQIKKIRLSHQIDPNVQCLHVHCSKDPTWTGVFFGKKKFNRREISNNSLIEFHIYICVSK